MQTEVMPSELEPDCENLKRPYTSKQMGDACEMLVAAELTLAGVPALKVPDNWPCYDVIAHPRHCNQPQRISVKSRTFKRGGGIFLTYDSKDDFEWLGIILLPGEDQVRRRTFLVPRSTADARAKRDGPTSKTTEFYWRVDKVAESLAEFENNFCLSPTGKSQQNRASSCEITTYGGSEKIIGTEAEQSLADQSSRAAMMTDCFSQPPKM